jgi:hypothetical protein
MAEVGTVQLLTTVRTLKTRRDDLMLMQVCISSYTVLCFHRHAHKYLVQQSPCAWDAFLTGLFGNVSFTLDPNIACE